MDINLDPETLREIYQELIPSLKKMEDRYTCVNHDLVYSEYDVSLNSEFRFMRSNKDFLFRQIASSPTMLVKNWDCWKISGEGVEHQAVGKESIHEAISSNTSYRLCAEHRKKLELPFF